MPMKMKGGTFAFLALGLIIAGLAIALWIARQYWASTESYNRCVTYFSDAGVGFDRVKGRSPGNDLRALLESRWGASFLVDLDEAFDWVAYDESRNVVYFLTWRGTQKIGLNQEGRLQKEGRGQHVGASRGFTDQIIFDRIEYSESTIAFSFHTTAREEERSVLDSFGLELNNKYVVRIDDSDHNFDLSAVDHDTFLRQAVMQTEPHRQE